MTNHFKDADLEHCITILMPFFNASNFLKEALESILNQSYTNIIVLLLNDGSTDDSLQIAQQIALTDRRVKIYSNSENLGIIKSRNKLLDWCETEYAAWMDCDDIAGPQRIEKQLQFMLNNPKFIACTCHYIRQGLGENTNILIPREHISREYLLFFNYILNPGSFFNVLSCKRNNVIFREWVSGASDYLFWAELAKYGELGLVEEVLMIYRLHPEQETVFHKQRQLTGVLEIVQHQLKHFGCNAQKQDLARLLGYPAQILKLNYRFSHLYNNALTIRTILFNISNHEFNKEVVESLLFTLYRSQARRSGVVGFVFFVKLFGTNGLSRCRLMGVDFMWAAIKTDLVRFGLLCRGFLAK